jgi:carbamoylphosphate synthase large subunit
MHFLIILFFRIVNFYALKGEEGKKVALMNPNIASVQTNMDSKSEQKRPIMSSSFQSPPNPLEEVIKKEKPDRIVVSMSGQTTLNCAVELYNSGIFEKYGVKILGTPIDVVINTKDRQLFSDKLCKIDKKSAESFTVYRVEYALVAAKTIGCPLMIRSAFALGGLGSVMRDDEAHLRDMTTKVLLLLDQILVEKSMKGWQEVEYEVVRDAYDNCVTVCNMENFDPLGIHTGDSIVMTKPTQLVHCFVLVVVTNNFV